MTNGTIKADEFDANFRGLCHGVIRREEGVALDCHKLSDKSVLLDQFLDLINVDLRLPSGDHHLDSFHLMPCLI